MSLTGHTLVKDSSVNNRCKMQSALRAIAGRNHSFNSIIDIGASDGRWTAEALGHFAGRRVLLLEAQALHELKLREFCAKHESVEYVIAVAGETRGSIHFDSSDPFGGIASRTPFPENDIELPVTTIDHEISARKLPGPFLIKFDTHGFEVPILKGATETLKNTDVIVMECYNYKIAEDCLLFNEMCDYMKNLGFRCIDMADPMHRPHDDTFWQMDLVFVKSDRPEFNYLKYT